MANPFNNMNYPCYNNYQIQPCFFPVPFPVPVPCIRQNISLPETIVINFLETSIFTPGIIIPSLTLTTSISNGVFVYSTDQSDEITSPLPPLVLQPGCSGFAVSLVKCPPTSTSITIDTFTIAGFIFSSQTIKLPTENGVYNIRFTNSGATASLDFTTSYNSSNWVINTICLTLWIV
jgi:hypothetical protein